MSKTNPFELDVYLERIELTERPAATSDGLRDLIRAQMRSIAFENLDPLIGMPVSLDLESLWRKLVVEKRGGYCFELNYLLASAMEYLGIDFTPMLARVMMGAPVGGPKSHLLFSVRIDGAELLADAGFGGPGLLAPMPFKIDTVVEQDGAQLKLIETEPNEYVLQRSTPDGWFNVFTFNREKVFSVDVEVANYFTSTMPRSPFRSQLMCAFQAPDGLISFRENSLVTLAPNMVPVSTVPLRDAADLERVLVKDFKLTVSSDIVRQAWEKVSKNG